MNETFRISDTALSQRRKGFALTLLIALFVLSLQFNASPRDPLVFVVVGAILIGIVVVMGLRQYREYAKFAQSHSLTLGDDFMLFRDGEVETRVPYGSITNVTVPRSVLDGSMVTLKCRDQPSIRLYGYAEFPRLVELLLRRVSSDIVRTRGLFAR